MWMLFSHPCNCAQLQVRYPAIGSLTHSEAIKQKHPFVSVGCMIIYDFY